MTENNSWECYPFCVLQLFSLYCFTCHRWEISLGIPWLEWQSKLETNRLICLYLLKYLKQCVLINVYDEKIILLILIYKQPETLFLEACTWTLLYSSSLLLKIFPWGWSSWFWGGKQTSRVWKSWNLDSSGFPSLHWSSKPWFWKETDQL